MVIKIRLKPALYVFAIAIVIAVVGGIAFLINFYKHLGAETYDAAVVAGDAGDEKKAIALFKEACREGSDLACEAIQDDHGKKDEHK